MSYQGFEDEPVKAPQPSRTDLRKRRRQDIAEALAQKKLAGTEHEGGESSETNTTRLKIARDRWESARQLTRKLLGLK